MAACTTLFALSLNTSDHHISHLYHHHGSSGEEGSHQDSHHQAQGARKHLARALESESESTGPFRREASR